MIFDNQSPYTYTKHSHPFYKKCLYVLTRDECFYVVSANLLKYSAYLNELAEENKSLGSYFYPIFLQRISGQTFQAILKYVEYLDNNCIKDTNKIIREINQILFKKKNNTNNDTNKTSNNIYLTFLETISHLQLPTKHDILSQIIE